jgi:DNA-binding MarR family transcriptional regulator
VSVPCWSPQKPSDELVVAFGRVLRSFRMQLADQGLEPATVALIHEVGRAGPVRPSALADAIGLDLSTVSRHVRNLVEAGHLARADDPGDRRAALLSVTPAGVALLEQTIALRSEVLARATDGWSAADVDQLVSLLTRLGDGLAGRTDDPRGTR